MECKINPKTIDRKGILSLLKHDKFGNIECVDCNLKVRMIKKIRCSDCPFVSCSGERKTAKNYFAIGVACGAKFRQYGINPNGRLGKVQLFYLLYHPELNWYLPNGSEIHHLNKENWNDHKWNLVLCKTGAEHKTVEAEQNKYRKMLNEQSFTHLR